MPLSPLDDRYAAKVESLEPIFSEYGLMRYRTIVEIEWLLFLSEKKIAPRLNEELCAGLKILEETFSPAEYARIKEIEKTTNHDVKAVEYFLREMVPEKYWPWIHFACTSEDINNLAYSLMLREGRDTLLNEFDLILEDIRLKAIEWKSIPMLARTHGQTATPTTMGKEWAVFYSRLSQIVTTLESIEMTGKINGATGTYSAHAVAFPDTDWIAFSQEFVEGSMGLRWNPLTTQIESHDQAALLLQELSRLSTVLVSFCRDIWSYVSLGYFGQKVVKGEVGSSTMPHKVNPIDFENAEGNLKIARSFAQLLAQELPISRLQRDLTDSTLQRNFGVVFGHLLLAIQSLKKGLGKLELRKERLEEDLEAAPEVLTEAVQTVLRAHGHADAYDQLKAFSRGKPLSLKSLAEFIDQSDLPAGEKKRLKALKPKDYTGLAEELVEGFLE